MHYHMEIVIPPTNDVEQEISKAMAGFSENNEYENDGFWDWYVIGGRYAGSKLEAQMGKERRTAFYNELNSMKVTVSGVVFGKETLQPATQQAAVDALWTKHFPELGSTCPLFSHYGDQHKPSPIYPDVVRLEDLPKDLTCYTFAVVVEERIEFLLFQEIWNGVTHQDTAWDGKVSTALTMQSERLKSYSDEWKAKATPGKDWLCVTLDYHS